MSAANIVDHNAISVFGWNKDPTSIHGWLQLYAHSCTLHVRRTCDNCSMKFMITLLRDLFASPQFWVTTTERESFQPEPSTLLSVQQFSSFLTSLRAVWAFHFTIVCPRCQSLFDMSMTPERDVGMVYSCRASSKTLPIQNPQKWVFPVEVQWAIWRFQQNLPFQYQSDELCLPADGMLDAIRKKYGTQDWRDASDLWGMERPDLFATSPLAQGEWFRGFPPLNTRTAQRLKEGCEAPLGLPLVQPMLTPQPRKRKAEPENAQEERCKRWTGGLGIKGSTSFDSYSSTKSSEVMSEDASGSLDYSSDSEEYSSSEDCSSDDTEGYSDSYDELSDGEDLGSEVGDDHDDLQ